MPEVPAAPFDHNYYIANKSMTYEIPSIIRCIARQKLCILVVLQYLF